MKLSIVLSTYNGEAYITEQLDSILNQTRKADEVLIFDDCSTDNTPQITARISFPLSVRRYFCLGWFRELGYSGANSPNRMAGAIYVLIKIGLLLGAHRVNTCNSPVDISLL